MAELKYLFVKVVHFHESLYTIDIIASSSRSH